MMLHVVSPHRAEGASSPSPPQLHSKRQLHSVPRSYMQDPSAGPGRDLLQRRANSSKERSDSRHIPDVLERKGSYRDNPAVTYTVSTAAVIFDSFAGIFQ